jgi:predicted nucleic acid-binding protein
MRQGEAVYVDTSAWIALALSRDPYHERAQQAWLSLAHEGARLQTSVPVVLETFTFLDRHAARDVALEWREALDQVRWLRILAATPADLNEAWAFFERRDLHKLSAVDAVSFVLMRKRRLRTAFAFDHHFATVGFHLVG